MGDTMSNRKADEKKKKGSRPLSAMPVRRRPDMQKIGIQVIKDFWADLEYLKDR